MSGTQIDPSRETKRAFYFYWQSIGLSVTAVRYATKVMSHLDILEHTCNLTSGLALERTAE